MCSSNSQPLNNLTDVKYLIKMRGENKVQTQNHSSKTILNHPHPHPKSLRGQEMINSII